MSKTIPYVIEQTSNGERSYDLSSRLLQDRMIFIDSGVSSDLSYIVSQQLLYLDSLNQNDITLYLTSPGGSVHSGLKIADTMDMCRSDIVIVGMGELCSMGCYLLAHGTPGKRFLTKRAAVMAHQVSSGTQGHVEDQEKSLEHTKYLNEVLGREIANNVGQNYATYMRDVHRDFWMNAQQALFYGKKGFCDGIIEGDRDANGELIIRRRADYEKPKASTQRKSKASKDSE